MKVSDIEDLLQILVGTELPHKHSFCHGNVFCQQTNHMTPRCEIINLLHLRKTCQLFLTCYLSALFWPCMSILLVSRNALRWIRILERYHDVNIIHINVELLLFSWIEYSIKIELRMSNGKKVGVVGSGLVGKSWAMIFASQGYQVRKSLVLIINALRAKI